MLYGKHIILCYKFHLYKCHTPAGLGAFSWGWGLPTLAAYAKPFET